MTLKITLTINQDDGAELVGLLAKAYGRGELGISALDIAREGDRAVKKVERVALASWAGKKTFALRSREPLGSKTKPGKPNGVMIVLRALRLEASLDGIKEAFRAGRLNRNGVGATLSKLKYRGYCDRLDAGVWRLTAKGVELDKKLNGPTEAERDSQNS